MNYEQNKKEDNREWLDIFLSMIKNNNTLFFLFYCKDSENDLFTRISVIILSLNFYIIFNAFLMFNSSSQHLYLDRDLDLHEKFEGKYFILNILIPSLLYLFTLHIRKLTSIDEFYYDKHNQYYEFDENKNKNKKLKDGEINIAKHDILTDISKFKNKKEKTAWKLVLYGSLFLFISWYYISCFLGIYDNSLDCLIMNILLSLFFTLIFTLIIFTISTTLKLYARKKENEFCFNVSQKLNPIYLFYDERPYNKLIEDVDEK